MSIHSIIKALHERITALENTHYALGVKRNSQGQAVVVKQEPVDAAASDTGSYRDFRPSKLNPFTFLSELQLHNIPLQQIIALLGENPPTEDIAKYEVRSKARMGHTISRYVVMWRNAANTYMVGWDLQELYGSFVAGMFIKDSSGVVYKTSYWNVPKGKDKNKFWGLVLESFGGVIHQVRETPEDIAQIHTRVGSFMQTERQCKTDNTSYEPPDDFLDELPEDI